MNNKSSRIYTPSLSFAALVLSLTGNPLMAVKPQVNPEDPGAERVAKALPAPQVVEANDAAHTKHIQSISDIGEDLLFLNQISLFSGLIDKHTETQPLSQEARTTLSEIRDTFESRLQKSSGVIPYNASWLYGDSNGRRLEQKFSASRQAHYSALASSALTEELDASLEAPEQGLKSDYFSSLAEAYGPVRLSRLLVEKPDLFESAGLGYRFTTLKNPKVLFPTSDPELFAIWDQAKPALSKLYAALGEHFDEDVKGPIYLGSQETGFPYSDQDLQSFETFKVAYANIPTARRFPQRALPVVPLSEEASGITQQESTIARDEEPAKAELAPDAQGISDYSSDQLSRSLPLSPTNTGTKGKRRPGIGLQKNHARVPLSATLSAPKRTPSSNAETERLLQKLEQKFSGKTPVGGDK